MELMLYIFLIISLTSLLYEITLLMVNAPDVRVEKKINRLKRRTKEKRESTQNVLLVRFFVPLFNYCLKNIKGLRFNEYKIRMDLEKVGISETAEVYMAKGFFYAVVAVVACMIMYMMSGFRLFLVLGFLFAFGFPFYPKSSLRGKITKINDELLKEFPNFVSALRYQYGRGKTLNDIVQSYIEVAGSALKYELQKLSAELEMMSDNDALLRFAERIGLPDVSNFATSLVYGQMYGMDINNIFAIQEQEMRRLSRDNIRKLMKRKPISLTLALMLPILNILMIIGIPPMIAMVRDFTKF